MSLDSINKHTLLFVYPHVTPALSARHAIFDTNYAAGRIAGLCLS